MKVFLTCVFFLIANFVFAQEYYVLQVKGKVKNLKTGKELKTSDAIKAEDQLQFSSATDAIAVVSSKTGRFILKPGAPTKQNEFLAFVKDALKQSSGKLSTRSGAFVNALDFQNYFSDTILLLPELKYAVAPISFPINENSFFFIRFNYKDEDINKQLPANADNQLIINRDELLKVDGQPVSPEDAKDFTLFYYDEKGETLLTPLRFNTTNPSIVRTQIEVIQKTIPPSGKFKINDEIIAYLQENFGKVDENNLKAWLKLK